MRFLLSILLVIAVGCGSDAPPPNTPEPTTDATPAQTETSTPKGEPATSPPPQPACVPAAYRLCPVDEGAGDAEFAAFRAELLDAVRRKDATRLLTLVDPNIRTSFGEGGGVDDFRRQWNIDSPDSRLWPELATILTMGGSFLGDGEQRAFWAPYVYANWPEGFDAFTHVAAVRAGVPLRSGTTETDPIVVTVDWEILEVNAAGATGENQWTRVRTHAGKEGWVSSEDVRSSVGYRAGFNRISGSWKLNALVAGD